MKSVNVNRSQMQVRATRRAPLTAALAIACTACAYTCMDRTQIHTLQHYSRTSDLPSPTMRHFTKGTQQASQTLPNLTTHSPQHTPTHGTLGSPAMSLSTTHNEPAASSSTRDSTTCIPCPLQIPIPTSYSIFTRNLLLQAILYGSIARYVSGYS